GLPAEEDPDDEHPSEHQPEARRDAAPGGAVRLRLDPAPLARAEDAEDEEAQPEGGEDDADEVELRPLGDGSVGDLARQHEDPQHDHDLAREQPAPGEVGRAEAADQRADRHGDGTGGGYAAVSCRPALRRE